MCAWCVRVFRSLGTPPALLGHKVSIEGLRPAFPATVPAAYQELAAACWAQHASMRPTFEAILVRLTAMRRALGGRTPGLRAYRPSTYDGAASVSAGCADGGHVAVGMCAGDFVTHRLVRGRGVIWEGPPICTLRLALWNICMPCCRRHHFYRPQSTQTCAAHQPCKQEHGKAAPGPPGSSSASDGALVFSFAGSFFARRTRARAADIAVGRPSDAAARAELWPERPGAAAAMVPAGATEESNPIWVCLKPAPGCAGCGQALGESLDCIPLSALQVHALRQAPLHDGELGTRLPPPLPLSLLSAAAPAAPLP